MNNATKKMSDVGQQTETVIAAALEVNADLAWKERGSRLDNQILHLVERYGLKAVLEAIQDAVFSGGQAINDGIEYEDDRTTVVALRMSALSRRLAEVIKTLR